MEVFSIFPKAGQSRRQFLRTVFYGVGGALLTLLPVFRMRASCATTTSKPVLRPPGALDESDFLKSCIGCYRCVTACPNQCLDMAGPEFGWRNLYTPVIQPRSRGCTLCMRCTEVCPTGALQRIGRDRESIQRHVKMGTAVINEELCFSYHGRTCGVCYRACPLAGSAMTVGLFEQPTVHADACVGCGLCEQACIHMPQAVRVRPA